MERSRKNALIALLLIATTLTGIFVGGYVATGNWNPWGNKHYYQVLNANFQECHTLSGTTDCTTAHNVLFNSGARWVQQTITSANQGFCAISATCSMNFIAMSAGTTAPAAGDATTGVTNGDCGKPSADTELTTNGFARAAATVTDIASGGASGSTSTLVKTFTATATQAVAKSCIVNQSTAANANNVQLAASTFTSITLQNLDTIQITWTITWTWS